MLQGGKRREQVEALEDEAAVVEPEAVDLAGLVAPQVLAHGADGARVGLQQAGQRGDQRRLAGAGGAHDHGDVAVQGLEVDGLQDLDVGAPGLEAFHQAFRCQGGLRAHRSRSAGWLFLRTPREKTPERIEMTVSRIATVMTQGIGKPIGMPRLVASR